MSSAHRIGSRDIVFPLRKLRGLKTLGPLSLLLMCATSILVGTSCIPESQPLPATGFPTEAMRTTVSQALGVLQDHELKKPEHTDERVIQLKKIADARFDYREMAKRSLGGRWDKIEEKERQEFVDLFTDLLTATYVEKIHDYSGEEVTFLNERLEGNYAEVKSLLVGKKTEIPMDYRLMKKGDDWKVYDVLIDGISLVQNYRGQFTAILRSSSYEHLVQILREKNTQLNVKTKSSETNRGSH